MADKFKLNIISPEKKFLEGDCEFLEFVSTEGELGIYAKHIPLTTILEPCVMRIHNDGEIKKAAILGGFVEILQERVRCLQKMHSGRMKLMWHVPKRRRSALRTELLRSRKAQICVVQRRH